VIMAVWSTGKPFSIPAVRSTVVSAGSVFGFMNMGAQLGGALSASLTPAIAASYGWNASFLVAEALCPLGGAAWLAVDPTHVLKRGLLSSLCRMLSIRRIDAFAGSSRRTIMKRTTDDHLGWRPTGNIRGCGDRTAMAEISIFAPFTRAATWTVVRVGFGSGKKVV
jgi:MFS family permease